MHLPRALIIPTLALAAMVASHGAHAEFYRWTDAHGRVRISNIPPRGIAADGSVLPGYNPLAIGAQQAALRAHLKARDAELLAASAAQSAAEDAADDSPDFDNARSK